MSTQRGPEQIGSILRNFLKSEGLAGKLRHLEVYSVWKETVDPAVGRHTHVAGFARHKLYIDVDSASHLHELRSFRKAAILGALRGKLPNLLIQDIVFRPASPTRS